jgi:NAD(P)-dependent dehydrogenase (short-subunit alcohol dehydrogenase family)
MDQHLEGKLALVSGSTAGIGLAIAAALAQEGARVIVNGRPGPAVDGVVAKLKETTGGDILDFAGDLTKATAAEELAQRYRDIAILVNNLGIFEPKPFEEISDADWMRFFDANVLSGVRLSRLFLPGHAARELGPDHVHFERERVADPRRDGRREERRSPPLHRRPPNGEEQEGFQFGFVCSQGFAGRKSFPPSDCVARPRIEGAHSGDRARRAMSNRERDGRSDALGDL